MLSKVCLSTKGVTLCAVMVLVVGMLLAPSGASPVLAQGVPAACLNDAGNPVLPSVGAGVGAWLIVLNFNHAPSTTTTTGCLVKTTALNPQKVIRTMLTCQVTNNDGQVGVGNGTAAFDGKFAIQCPGITEGPGVSHDNTNFTLWGRANFAQTNQTYALVTHTDVNLSVSVTGNASTPNNPWYASLSSRYGSTTFVNSDATVNVRGQIVPFESAVGRGTGIHKLNQTALSPETPVAPFSFHYNQPISIGGAGPQWTLHELVIDPPGGCCKGG